MYICIIVTRCKIVSCGHKIVPRASSEHEDGYQEGGGDGVTGQLHIHFFDSFIYSAFVPRHSRM